MTKFELEKAEDGIHKYVGVFTRDDGTTKSIPFGNIHYQDYTTHHNRLRQKMYLVRHHKREDWNNPETAGALSRWILWSSPNIQTAVRMFKHRFNLV